MAEEKKESQGINISGTHGDVFGVGVSGSDNIIGKNIVFRSGTININETQLQKIPHHTKPKTFHGEKPIFVGRQYYIEQIKEYFRTSNDPITIFGMGGMGKSSLAFEAIHQSEDMFDLIIPIYFAELGISINSLLSSVAKSLNISLVDFDKLEVQDRKQFLIILWEEAIRIL